MRSHHYRIIKLLKSIVKIISAMKCSYKFSCSNFCSY